jgi:hypothetical protein
MSQTPTPHFLFSSDGTVCTGFLSFRDGVIIATVDCAGVNWRNNLAQCTFVQYRSTAQGRKKWNDLISYGRVTEKVYTTTYPTVAFETKERPSVRTICLGLLMTFYHSANSSTDPLETLDIADHRILASSHVARETINTLYALEA